LDYGLSGKRLRGGEGNHPAFYGFNQNGCWHIKLILYRFNKCFIAGFYKLFKILQHA
jgi:hypothetical protein